MSGKSQQIVHTSRPILQPPRCKGRLGGVGSSNLRKARAALTFTAEARPLFRGKESSSRELPIEALYLGDGANQRQRRPLDNFLKYEASNHLAHKPSGIRYLDRADLRRATFGLDDAVPA